MINYLNLKQFEYLNNSNIGEMQEWWKSNRNWIIFCSISRISRRERRFKLEGNHKDSCLTFMDYPAFGAPNPLSTERMPCCIDCQTRGNHSEECLYLQKIVSTSSILYCNFCWSMGHDEKDCTEY